MQNKEVTMSESGVLGCLAGWLTLVVHDAKESGWLDVGTMVAEWGVFLAILIEGVLALREYRSNRQFNIIRYIEDKDMREARMTLYQKLIRNTPATRNWWDEDTDLADAAALVCARYDIVGVLTKKDPELREFVLDEWSANIRWTYEAVSEFVKDRRASGKTGRPDMYADYAQMYEIVRPRNPPA
jgi:hypothetical protein